MGNIEDGRRCRKRAFLLQLTAASATGHVKAGDDTMCQESCCLRTALRAGKSKRHEWINPVPVVLISAGRIAPVLVLLTEMWGLSQSGWTNIVI